MEGVIFIKGELGVEKDVNGNPGYTLSNALIDLERNKMAEVLHLFIDSPGGSYNEGLKICNLFGKSGKIIITENSGDIASMAVNIFLLGSQRFYDPSKGVFLIHNPWGSAEGDADSIVEYSKELKKAEKELAALYVKRTGALPEVIAGLMAIDQPLTAEQVETLGFAKIINNEFKAVAKLNYKQMTEEELNKKIDEGANSIFSKIKEFFKKTGVIKAFNLQTADGQTLDFGDEIQEATQIAVDSPVTIDGKPAEGDYLLPDGTTLVCAGGKVTEIKPKEEAPEENEEMATLKAENESLKIQLESAKGLMQSIENEFKSFKKEVTSDIKGLKNEPPANPDDRPARKPFKN